MPLLTHTTWKVSKYGAISGLYFPAFGLNTDQKSLYIWTLFTQGQKRFQSLLFSTTTRIYVNWIWNSNPVITCSKLTIKTIEQGVKLSSKFNNKDIRTMPLAYQIFISLQMRALQKLWKILFISSKKLSSFSRYSNFCISIFPSFSACQPLL